MATRTRIPARRLLRRWREKHDYTQEQIGNKIGKGRVLIALFEGGQQQLTLPDRRKLARFTGIPLSKWMTPNEIRDARDTASELGPEAA